MRRKMAKFCAYAAMSLMEISEFIGLRLLLLMPATRDHFKEEIEQMANRDGA